MKKALSIGIMSLMAAAPIASVVAQRHDSSLPAKAIQNFSFRSRRSDLASTGSFQQQSGVAALTSANGKNSTSGKIASDEAGSDSKAGGAAAQAQKNYDSAMAFYDSGKLKEAIAAFKQANKLRPENAQTYYMLGMVYSKARAYKDAADSFKRAVRYKPDWPDAHFKLGTIAYVLGKKAESIEEYKKLQELNSPLAATLFRIIKVESGAGETTSSSAAGIRIIKQERGGDEATPGSAAGNGEAAPKQLEVVPLSDSVKDIPTASVAEPTPGVAVSESSSHSRSAVPPDNRSTMSSTRSLSANTPASVSDNVVLTSIYKIGVGDVLDIRLLNSAANRSTLYTVMDGGVIDFPIAGGAVPVAGLTAAEIQTNIVAELKRRAVEESAQLSVSVRQYSSHTVVITGLVNNPGTKILRREAVPLYLIMAEAQPRPDAGRAAIMRNGMGPQLLDLSDQSALNVTVRPGDLISVTARPQEFYYIAGRINYPGQKAFQPGITLLQALLAAGGPARQGDNVELSREGSDGRLTTTKFKLKEIKSGKIQDPRLQPGDRIEVIH